MHKIQVKTFNQIVNNKNYKYNIIYLHDYIWKSLLFLLIRFHQQGARNNDEQSQIRISGSLLFFFFQNCEWSFKQ